MRHLAGHLVGALLALAAGGCLDESVEVHDRIADIKADPVRYQQREVILRGEAVAIHSPVGFELADGGLFTEDIFVLTPRGQLPRLRAGQWVELRGAVRRFSADVEDEYSIVVDGSLEPTLSGRPVVIALQTLR